MIPLSKVLDGTKVAVQIMGWASYPLCVQLSVTKVFVVEMLWVVVLHLVEIVLFNSSNSSSLIYLLLASLIKAALIDECPLHWHSLLLVSASCSMCGKFEVAEYEPGIVLSH